MQILKSFFKALGCGIKFINTYFKTFVLLLIVIWILIPSANSSSNLANLERIDLKGEILTALRFWKKLSMLKMIAISKECFLL